MSELTVKADIKELDRVLAFVDGALESVNCSMKVQMQIDVAVEEIFVNIASYAYPDGIGEAKIAVYAESDKVMITFEDCGIKYDPLQNEDPDITLSANERPIGGLGVYMVKKTMDSVSYEYKENKNRLTIIKNL